MNTNWYYAKDGKPEGPLDLAAITALYQEGKIAPDALVWEEGKPDWVPASTVLAMNGNAGMGSASVDAALTGSVGRVDIGACLNEGFRAFGDHWGTLVLGTLIAIVIPMAINIPFTIADMALGGLPQGGKPPEMNLARGLVALASVVVGMAIQPPLQAGYILLVLQALRGRPELGTLFQPYKTCWMKLVGATVLIFLAFMVAALLPAGGLFYALTQKQILLAGVFGFVLLLLVSYVSLCFIYVSPLIADAGCGVFEALQRSVQAVNANLLQIFALSVVALVLYIAGLLLCCVGLLATLPIALAIIMAAYRQILMRQSPVGPA